MFEIDTSVVLDELSFFTFCIFLHCATMLPVTVVSSQLISAGDKVTVSCAEGDTGFIYKGELKFETLGLLLHNWAWVLDMWESF